jgi:hypothetical protein
LIGKNDVGDAISSLFGGITTANDCYINFNDAIYMNNGIVKIDNEYIKTEYIDDKAILTALNYIDMYNNDKTYLNLSNVTSVDQFVFNGIEDLASISFLGD